MNGKNDASHSTSSDKPIYILAIETSCDETSVAIVRDGHAVLSNMISSQIDVHRRFGGVVPEIASRKHVETITVMIEQAVEEAGISLNDVSAIAVTQGPGLVGALLVGIVAAKSLAMALNIPLIGTHHIAGHIYANQLTAKIEYPCMALVVSGGHTELVHIESEGQFKLIGRTRDDAVGEAYDKVARAANLPYPGGPHIDKLACEAEEVVEMPRSWLETGSYDFSFSGLKSAVLNVVNQSKMKGNEPNYPAIARGFQESVIDVLVGKAMRAVKEYDAKQLLLCGGVAANKGLRAELTARCEAEGVPLLVPPMEYCTDNAAMIGAAGYLKWKQQDFTSLDFNAHPTFSLEGWSVK
ncbi:tRNA (adenosine(37)-N6)-threonylcarbamoyltransferase complex transferase subunit TsaD [Paenibacillus sp. SC116]|uniref:tRNA (adenosine(37)-N6)-threonylcarbamoyltransferase complex transferase subunit TsaD n=1 Tax=Paenibacillus sp. SC116 TaxID=2968986 RepID=UPI00215A1777|nr:tRNA (adenosine(37)-N6)-threonylcarbamoyltransferase complex transferase subunit TsaD [Paenibacillus sp. SC116]MCR8844147.1 tRNA (adenosine(37)-N6)-threonylcarbamoyltransferase complex transferase subunit TsaD [Paenibacillus sp. SC116]